MAAAPLHPRRQTRFPATRARSRSAEAVSATSRGRAARAKPQPCGCARSTRGAKRCPGCRSSAGGMAALRLASAEPRSSPAPQAWQSASRRTLLRHGSEREQVWSFVCSRSVASPCATIEASTTTSRPADARRTARAASVPSPPSSRGSGTSSAASRSDRTSSIASFRSRSTPPRRPRSAMRKLAVRTRTRAKRRTTAKKKEEGREGGRRGRGGGRRRGREGRREASRQGAPEDPGARAPRPLRAHWPRDRGRARRKPSPGTSTAGITRTRTTRRSTRDISSVSPRISGTVVGVYFNDNQVVKAGDLSSSTSILATSRLR